MSQLTPSQRRSLRIADRSGSALVTMIDGRLALILPAVPAGEQASLIGRVVDGLESAGIGVVTTGD